MYFEEFNYIPLLTERVNRGSHGYKHFAPPEARDNEFRHGLAA